MDVDARVEDAARRKMLKETGLTAGAVRLFRVYSGPDMARVYPNGDAISNVDVLFVSEDFRGELAPEHTERGETGFPARRFAGADFAALRAESAGLHRAAA